MKKINFNYQKVLAVVFVSFVTVSMIATFVINPKQVFGGLVRGYINTDKDSSITDKIGSSFTEFDGRMNEYYAFHDASINAYGGVQKLIGKKLIDDVDSENCVLKLNNDYLTFKNTSSSDYSYLEDYIIGLNRTCQKNNTKLLYLNKVDKNTSDKTILPDNYPYVFSSNYSTFEKSLIQNDIQVLNIDNIVKEQNIDKYSLFFKTDHHWTPRTGLWVSKLITQKLNAEYGFSLPVENCDINNYNTETYQNAFLGSQGKRVGCLYDGVDDFDVITPNFDTDLSLSIKSSKENLSGNFEQTFIHKECITPDNLLNKDETAYDTYMMGNHDLVEIENKLTQNNKRALLVIDSYGCVVVPYLSLNFQYTDCIDLRSFSTSLEEYIINTKPDVVIYMTENYQ